MSSEPQSPSPPIWDWPSWMKGSVPNPLDILAAPKNLVQPILPGWFSSVTNITEQNSSAPDTEREIVAVHSYGRQLGRVMDALAVLIADSPKQDPAFDEFAKMRRQIDDIKANSAARRLDRAALDLATLKAMKPEEYERLVAKLRDALK